MIFKHLETVAAIRLHGSDVIVRCGRCQRSDPVDLASVEAEYGPLYSLWNKRPTCPAPGCGEGMIYQASKTGSGVWPVHMVEADPGRVAFLDAAWRADGLNSDMGGRLALQLMVGVVRQMGRYGMLTTEERELIVREAVQSMPDTTREDAAWLMRHYLDLGQDRPGWR